jgi:hypothetical protein
VHRQAHISISCHLLTDVCQGQLLHETAAVAAGAAAAGAADVPTTAAAAAAGKPLQAFNGLFQLTEGTSGCWAG